MTSSPVVDVAVGVLIRHDGRFLLGLGVSHHTLTEWVRKHSYAKPLTRMRETFAGSVIAFTAS